jgi:hypothetical protein
LISKASRDGAAAKSGQCTLEPMHLRTSISLCDMITTGLGRLAKVPQYRVDVSIICRMVQVELSSIIKSCRCNSHFTLIPFAFEKCSVPLTLSGLKTMGLTQTSAAGGNARTTPMRVLCLGHSRTGTRCSSGIELPTSQISIEADGW